MKSNARRTRLSATVSGLNLTHGDRYFVNVRAVDAAGNTVVASSDGVRVDMSPPEVGRVTINGTLADATNRIFVQSLNGISVAWEGIRDAESGVESFSVGVGTGRCGSPFDVMPLRSVGVQNWWRMDEAVATTWPAAGSQRVRSSQGGAAGRAGGA